jgi:uncharacterized membrane protein YsdA (DUF1294 family)
MVSIYDLKTPILKKILMNYRNYRSFVFIALVTIILSYLIMSDWGISNRLKRTAATSIASLLLYLIDKILASLKGNNKRVPENLLHILALAGGYPGAWLGRRLFNHKTRKSSFGTILLVSALLNLILWKTGV